MKSKRITPYPLRMSGNLREWVTKKAKDNRRSINAELTVLIEVAKEAIESKEGESEKPV